MAFAAFHPVVRQWFTTEVGEPTSAQLRGWDSIAAGRHTLIAAPTGSGKTLAAFLTAINALLEESLTAELPDEVRVVYVSPLKALSTDIHKNLAEPRAGIPVSAAHLGPQPADAAHGAHRDRGRDPRGHRRAPRRAPRPDAGAAGRRRREPFAADRPVRNADANRRGREVPDGRGPWWLHRR